MLFSYSEGGASKAADLDFEVTRKITYIYFLGTFAFVCGSKLSPFFGWVTTRHVTQTALRLFRLNMGFRMLCWGTVGLFVLSKVLLRGRGVYSDYAFDTGSMIGGVWSFSMFCSESLLLLSIVVLFSNAKRNVLWFLILTGINGINLLHGTRIFFVIAGITLCFYLYVRGRLTFKIAILAFGCLLLVGYLIFLSRSQVEVDDQTFSFTRIISPIMFEGIFSQLSLIETIRHPEMWSLSGSPHHFFLDALYFVTPRFLLPGKDQLLFTDRFADLSPLGAFSGYAQGLIYFGILFPFFYFVLGIIAGWLQRHAKHSQFWSVIYVYFVCDFLFRIMRDGYVMPVKMLLNALVILLVVSCLRLPQMHLKLACSLPQHLRRSPQVGSS
jgi:oligosaccharide repeat unit polymerase